MLCNRLRKAIKLVKHFSLVSMNSQKCIVAVCQFTATNNKDHNLQIVKKLIEEAAEKNAKIVFLPEACDYIGLTKEETRCLSETITGPIMTKLKDLAKTHNIWLSFGIHERVDAEIIRNSHIIIDGNGEIQSIYGKLHLFDVTIPEKNINLVESDIIERGKRICTPICTPAGYLASSICYDLRFPELSIIQRRLGAEILTYPSAFTHATGVLHWEVLLRARAIETQCYVIAAAQYGRHNEKRLSYGHAVIIDPLGRVVAECPKYSEQEAANASIAVATIDRNLVEDTRSNIPVFQHRRNDCYQLNIIEIERQEINDDESFLFGDKVIPGSTVFYKTKYTIAFTNIRCVVPGHVLIATIKSARRLQQLDEWELADLFQTAVKVQKCIETCQSANSSTICVQDGQDAGQTVPHVHIHVLPRKANDFERNDDVYGELAKHDRHDNQTPLRSIEEMTEEARTLRNYFTDN